MVSKPDTGQRASEEVESQRGMDTRQCANKDVGPLRGVNWGVPHRLDKETSANKDAGPRREVDCEIPTLAGEENETFFINA